MTGNPPRLNDDLYSGYPSLLGAAAWRRLHPDIRRRFGGRDAQRAVSYRGTMHEVWMSPAGILLAWLCRSIGTPLALYRGVDVPVTVQVYPDRRRGGMTWDRCYYFAGKKVNRVRSTKCIQPQAGLVELVGFGFGMYLNVTESAAAIHFRSTRFFWRLGRFKIPVPHILSPGTTTVVQTALDDGSFRFQLDVVHPLLGRVFRQAGSFVEVG